MCFLGGKFDFEERHVRLPAPPPPPFHLQHSASFNKKNKTVKNHTGNSTSAKSCGFEAPGLEGDGIALRRSRV